MNNDLKFAFRQILKNPGSTWVSVSSLAVGLTVAATTLALVNAYLIRSLPYPTSDRLYHVMYAPPGPYEPQGMTAIDWKLLEDVVEDAITQSGATFYVMDEGSVRTFRSLRVSPGFIRGLGIQPIVGRAFTQDEYATGAEEVALIGHELWRDRFGSDPQVVGRMLRVNRDELATEPGSLRIVGVLPPGFWFGRDSSARVDVLTTLRQPMRTYMVRLRDGVPVSHAEQRITWAARNVGSDFRPGWTGVQLESMHDRYVASIRPVLLGISIAVGMLLVLVFANVSLLMLLRTTRRQKETAVRVALGAGTGHILRILIAESLLVCGMALFIGTILSHLSLRVLAPLVEERLGRPSPAGPSAIPLDLTVVGSISLGSLAIAFGLALLPWVTPWRHRLADALRAQGTHFMDGPAMRRLRTSLIVCEVAGSVVLLTGCGLMIRSAVNLMNTDLGFNPRQVIRVGLRLPARTYAETTALHRFYSALLERIPQRPDSPVALMSAFPSYYPANTAPFEAPDSSTLSSSAGLMRVGAGYFKLYDSRVRQGREFISADQPGSQPVAMISETLARKLWAGEGAIGRQIRVVEGDMPGSPFGPWRTVVGVAGDIRQGYDDTDLGDIYLPFLQAPGRFASIHVRTPGAISFWEQTIRTAATQVDPFVQVTPAKTIVSEDKQCAGTQFMTSLLTGFAVFSMLLAAIGIYGVTTYVVRLREREIAIRVAVGATQTSIIRMFLKDGARVLAVGLSCGLIGTIGVSKLLQNQVYGVQPVDALTLVAVLAIMMVIGLLATGRPAKQGANRDPISVLKEG